MFSLLHGEISVVELATPVAFAAAAAFLVLRALRSQGASRAWALALALVFVVFAGEEVSWGQTYLKFATPGTLLTVNSQEELNAHNIVVLRGLVGTAHIALAAVLFVVLPAARLRPRRLISGVRIVLLLLASLWLIDALDGLGGGERAAFDTADAGGQRLETILQFALVGAALLAAAAAPRLLGSGVIKRLLASLRESFFFAPQMLSSAAILGAGYLVYGLLLGNLWSLSFFGAGEYPVNVEDELLELFVGILAVQFAMLQLGAGALRGGRRVPLRRPRLSVEPTAAP